MGGEYVGDWSCPNCDATVFASKNNCYKCQTPKPARAAAAEASGGGSGYANTFTAIFGRPPPLPPVQLVGSVRCELVPRPQMAAASKPSAAVAAGADVNGQDESQRVRSRRRRVRGNWTQLIKAFVRRLHFQLLDCCPIDDDDDFIYIFLHDDDPGQDAICKDIKDIKDILKFSLKSSRQVKDLESGPMPAEAAPSRFRTFSSRAGVGALSVTRESEVAHETMVAAGYIFDHWVFHQKPPVGIFPMIEQWDAFAGDLSRLKRERNVTTEEGQQVTGEARFTLVSWNIQGLGGDEPLNEVILRTEVAMRELLALAPTVICLQEVVPETVETIEGMLGGRYLDVECFHLKTVVMWTVGGLVKAHVDAHGHYFTKMFVSQRAIFVNGLTVNAVSRFPLHSQQGRDLLLVTLEHKGKRMCVATTHLESGRDRRSEHLRQYQLQYSLRKIEKHSVQRAQDLFLLVGDMNLGIQDQASIRKIIHGWEDADEKDEKVTWDAGSNKRVLKMLDFLDDKKMRPRDPKNKQKKNRFDRCYFKIRSILTSEEATAAKLAWKFCGAKLVGTNINPLLEQSDYELTRSGYVSDHYGLFLEWEVSEKHMANEVKKLEEHMANEVKKLEEQKKEKEKLARKLEMKTKALKDAERQRALKLKLYRSGDL